MLQPFDVAPNHSSKNSNGVPRKKLIVLIRMIKDSKL